MNTEKLIRFAENYMSARSNYDGFNLTAVLLVRDLLSTIAIENELEMRRLIKIKLDKLLRALPPEHRVKKTGRRL